MTGDEGPDESEEFLSKVLEPDFLEMIFKGLAGFLLAIMLSEAAVGLGNAMWGEALDGKECNVPCTGWVCRCTGSGRGDWEMGDLIRTYHSL